MSGPGAPALPAAHPGGELEAAPLKRLTALLDGRFLQAIGWDAAAQAFAPPPSHPQLGRPVCIVAGCNSGTPYSNGLCAFCRDRYRSSGLDFPDFVKIERVHVRPLRTGPLLCAVPGCGRPRLTTPAQLCSAHEAQQQRRGLSVASFITDPQVCPLPGFGECRVAACADPAHGHRRLCQLHEKRWVRDRRRSPYLDFDRWCQIQGPPRSGGACVVLRGLPPLVQAELLYGLQERCRHGAKARLEALRKLCELLRRDQVRSVLEVAVPPYAKTQTPPRQRIRRPEHYVLAAEVQTAVRRAFSSPELERRKDRQDMAVYGHRGTLDFTGITQQWLRQAAMEWVHEDAPKRRGDGVGNTIQSHVGALEMLSASLRLQRADHGADPALLGRKDIVAFLNRLAHLETVEGKEAISAQQRIRVIRQAGKVLRDCRALGLTRPGWPLAGLPDDFAIRVGDAPKPPDRSEQGRALPQAVVEQLVTALPQLEQRSGRAVSVAVQLVIDTGRRPDEVCKLPWDCLERDPDGKHALVYTDFKNNRIGRRLAIADATAGLIIEQQQAVRARFPATPLGDLVLLPRAYRNPHGTRPMADSTLGDTHRDWVDALPALWSGDRTESGTKVAFDRARVVLYAYRHTYAQRHADAGTRVEDLSELMGHDSLASTQTYYRITAKRTRAAVDRLAALQFDGRGRRVWREGRALLEHEHQRRAVGQVAVPFGICTEPSNVKAGGHACPFRFRCHGCGHFRSDPSYLPELRGYLDMLLRNRERVRAAVELEEWARAEAMPSDEEISRVRALIRRVETDLEQLSEDERQQIDEACRIVRATRQTIHLGMPTIRPPNLDPTLDLNREDLA